MINVVSSFLDIISLFFKNNSISIILITLCTFLGAFWGKKGLSKKRLSFKSVSFPIIRKNTNAISNVDVSYKNQSIPNLTITNFIIWSSSDKSIRRDDIVPLSPLHFNSKNPDAKILDISIIETNNASSNIQITPYNDKFIFSFDYLKKKSGAVVQIIHTGQDIDIEFAGELIDGNLKCENFPNYPIFKHITKISPKMIKIMDAISLISICISLFFIAIVSFIIVAFQPFSLITILFLFILVIILYFYLMLYKTYFNVPRTLNSYLTLNN